MHQCSLCDYYGNVNVGLGIIGYFACCAVPSKPLFYWAGRYFLFTEYFAVMRCFLMVLVLVLVLG